MQDKRARYTRLEKGLPQKLLPFWSRPPVQRAFQKCLRANASPENFMGFRQRRAGNRQVAGVDRAVIAKCKGTIRDMFDYKM